LCADFFKIWRLPIRLLYDYKIKMQKTFKKKNNIIRENSKAQQQGRVPLRRVTIKERMNKP
jgi:hypothetical protein